MTKHLTILVLDQSIPEYFKALIIAVMELVTLFCTSWGSQLLFFTCRLDAGAGDTRVSRLLLGRTSNLKLIVYDINSLGKVLSEAVTPLLLREKNRRRENLIT